MTKPSNPNDANLLSRAGAVDLERRVDGKSCAHHRGGIFGFDGVGDREDELVVSVNCRGIASLGDDTIFVFVVLVVKRIR